VVGWRGAFFAVVPVAAIALVWKLFSLPGMKAGQGASPGGVFRLLKRPAVALGMLAVSLFFLGQFALFTYLRPFLESVTQLGVSALSLMLLLVGVAGFVGTTAIGGFLENSLYRMLIVIPLLMAGLALALIAFGSSVAASAVLLGIWGLVATSAPVAWWTWLARSLPQDAEAGGGLMVAVVQLAIASGATFGGILFDASGYRATFGMSAAVLVAAAGVAWLAARAAKGSARHA
jgi:predicted MFS family arabinose efflux permease